MRRVHGPQSPLQRETDSAPGDREDLTRIFKRAPRHAEEVLTAGCREARARFEGYLGESLSREERCAVRSHLSGCGSCRRDASRLDPALFFAAVRPEPVSDSDAALILEGVRAGIALKTAERRIERPPSHGRRAGAMAAAAAAALLIGLTLSGPSSARLDRGREDAPAAASAAGPARADDAKAGPAAVTANPVMSGRAFSPFAEASAPGGRKVPADATIYDWNPGGGKPRVVWIVDRSLDI